MKANTEQRKAIKYGQGPLLIIAGAGTGKTTVIAERILYLISSGLCSANEVLALTFTDKSAREMQERVDIIMPYGVTQMWISTFHSFCDRLLREEGLQIGLDPSYKLITASQSLQLISQKLFEFDLNYYRPMGNPTKFMEGLVKHFSRLKDEDITADAYLKFVQNYNFKDPLEFQKYLELAKAYKKYEELKTAQSLMDWGDLITNTLILFRKRQNVLSAYQEKFKYILVDEFQDTNFAQSQLVYLLAEASKNITVVGDDDQSIYKFRGASVSNILDFRKKFSDAKSIVLTKNYRSRQDILDKAYNLISKNNPDRLEVLEKIDKHLVAIKRGHKRSVFFIHAKNAFSEVSQVIKTIKKLIRKNGYKFSDFAILVRANSHAEIFVKSLEDEGIPVQFLGPKKLFGESEIADLIAILRSINNIDDSLNLFKVFSMSEFSISQIDLVRTLQFSKRKSLTLFETIENLDEVKISTQSKEKLLKIITILKECIDEIRKESAGTLLFSFLQKNDLMSQFFNPEKLEAEAKAKNIAGFFEKLKELETTLGDGSLERTLSYIDLSLMATESQSEEIDWTQNNVVNIMTIHAAKGLEFPVVFLPSLVTERFPSRMRPDQIPLPKEIIKETLPKGDFHMQEERRLFYVGMTRAKDFLYLSAADYYGEGIRARKVSPFVSEALGSQLENRTITNLTEPNIGSNNLVKTNSRKPNTTVGYLSYSHIEAFEICPLHYKLRYIIGLSTPATASQSFGISIHRSLKEFYKSKNKSERSLIKCLKNNWLEDGYLDKKHKNLAFKKATNYLKDYFKKEFNPKLIPAILETPFTINLTSKNGEKLQIGGVIDRADEHKDGTFEIIDYKTGSNIPSQREVDKNLQLTIYALAASKVFGKKPEDIKLSLYYFEEQKKFVTKRSAKELRESEKKLFEIKSKIEKSYFKCSNNFLCRNCEFSDFCGFSSQLF